MILVCDGFQARNGMIESYGGGEELNPGQEVAERETRITFPSNAPWDVPPSGPHRQMDSPH